MNALQTAPSATPSPSPNRLPTQQELDHAAMLLRSFGNSPLARQVETGVPLFPDEGLLTLVVTDFNHVPDAQVLLVPPGIHQVPADFLETERYIICLSTAEGGLPPVLMINAQPSEVIHSNTGESTHLHECNSSAIFAELTIYAPQPTVLRVYFGDNKQFSDVFFQVEWGQNADALNIARQAFYNGWHWALAAYGSHYRKRDTLERGVDAVHEGVMTAIDSVFKPLVRLGGKLDRALGLK